MIRQAHQKGVCRGCGEVLQLVGDPDSNVYAVVTHLATEKYAAKLGIRCFGSDIAPRTEPTTSRHSGLIVK